jgi:hypothetical protein
MNLPKILPENTTDAFEDGYERPYIDPDIIGPTTRAKIEQAMDRYDGIEDPEERFRLQSIAAQNIVLNCEYCGN